MKKLKIVLIGSNAVGKTSIANRFTRNLFANRYINTIGCDFYIKNVTITNDKAGVEEYKLVLHDIGGQLEFREFRKKYIDNADIVFIVFALNDLATQDISEYIEDVSLMPVKPLWAIVGNKLDLMEKRPIDLTDIHAIANKHGVPVYLVSAKENTLIQELFMESVKKYIEYLKKIS